MMPDELISPKKRLMVWNILPSLTKPMSYVESAGNPNNLSSKVSLTLHGLTDL